MTATLAHYRRTLQHYQSLRLRRDYHDLAAIPQYQAVGEFFFSEIYGPRDFTNRDTEARRLQHMMHMLPGLHWHDIEQALDLLDTTQRLDDDLAALMFHAHAPLDFDEPTYDWYYRAADNYDQRFYQLNLIRDVLQNVFRLSRSTLLGVGLKQSRLFARLAGVEEVHRFLRDGYEAIRVVDDMDHFVTTVHTHELAHLNRIYASAL